MIKSLKSLLSSLPKLHINKVETVFIFIIISLTFGTLFAFIIPVGYNNDETSHVLKAGAISVGEFYSKKLNTTTTPEGEQANTYGSAVPKALTNLEYAAGSLRHEVSCNSNSLCPQPSLEAKIEIDTAEKMPLKNSEKAVVDLMGANIYNPLAYLPAATVIWIGGSLSLPVGLVVILARIATLFVFIILSSAAIHILKKSSARWIIFCVALLPGSLVAATSVGVDGLLNGLALLMFALIIRSFTERKISPVLHVALIIVGTLLPLLKLPYAIVSLIVIALPIYAKGIQGLVFRFISLIIMLSPALFWTRIVADANRTQSLYVHAGSTPPDFHAQIIFILTHPIDYIASLIKSVLVNDWLEGIGSLTHQTNVHLPSLLMFGGLALVIFAGYISYQHLLVNKSRIRLFRILILCTPIVATLGISTALYLAFNPVGANLIEGVQGRYLIPLLPFFALSIPILLPIKVDYGKSISNLFTYSTVLILTLTCFWYYIVVY